MDVAVSNVMRFAGVGLPQALQMASANPAALLRLAYPDDHILFDLEDTHLRLRAVVREGELLWTDSSATAEI